MARIIVAMTAFNGYDDRRLTEHFHLAERITRMEEMQAGMNGAHR